MKKLLSLLLVFLAPVASAGSTCVTGSQVLVPFAYETIDVSSSAVTLTAATYAPTNCTAQNTCAVAAIIAVDTNAIRWTSDGTTPTATVGMPAAVGGFLSDVCQQDIANFKAIRQSSDAKIYVTYYRNPQ